MISQPLVADTHVHLYPRYSRERLFNQVAAVHAPSEYQSALCLTEKKGVREFPRLIEEPPSGWSVEKTEKEVLYCVSEQTKKGIWIFDGFQAVSAEGIEVLALVTSERPSEEQPLETIVKQILDGGGVAVVPWGFGKWWKVRVRKSLEDILNRYPILLADSALRPRLFPWEMSAYKATLFGTDPLDCAREEKRVGQYATCWKEGFSSDKAAHSMKELLRQGGEEWGKPLSLLHSIYTQIQLRIEKYI